MKRRFFIPLILVFVWVVTTADACTSPPAATTRPLATIPNDLAGGKVTFTHQLPGEYFDLVTEFSTPDPIQYWHITEPKLVNMRAWIVPHDNTRVEVLIEHVHADAFIQSVYSGWDGVITDSMDDSIHGVAQPGFWVTPEYPYQEVFSIEGHSMTMYESWTVFYADFISSNSSRPEPMTEENLINDGGTRGQKFQIIWDLAIRYPDQGESLYHTTSIVDYFAVPVDQTTLPVDVSPTPTPYDLYQ